MIKLDQAQARSLMRLRDAPELAPVRRWLVESLADTDRKLRCAEGALLARYQGQAQCLAEILDKIESAREIAGKLDT